MQRSALCRSRRELSNAYFLAKFGFDTAENEPSKVCPIERVRADGFVQLWNAVAAAQENLANLSKTFIGGIDPDGWVVSDETSKHFHRKFNRIVSNFLKISQHSANI